MMLYLLMYHKALFHSFVIIILLSICSKFIKFANEIIDKVHNRDYRKCPFMMLQEIKEWGNESAFSIIALRNIPDVMQSDGYIGTLETAWARNIDSNIPNPLVSYINLI